MTTQNYFFQDQNEDELIHEKKLPDKQFDFLSQVTISLHSKSWTNDITIPCPSSLSDYYDFALEEKILGLGT